MMRPTVNEGPIILLKSPPRTPPQLRSPKNTERPIGPKQITLNKNTSTKNTERLNVKRLPDKNERLNARSNIAKSMMHVKNPRVLRKQVKLGQVKTAKIPQWYKEVDFTHFNENNKLISVSFYICLVVVVAGVIFAAFYFLKERYKTEHKKPEPTEFNLFDHFNINKSSASL